MFINVKKNVGKHNLSDLLKRYFHVIKEKWNTNGYATVCILGCKPNHGL